MAKPTIGSKVAPKDKYALGTPAEVSNRDKTGFQPKGPSMQPVTGGGGSLANPPRGNTKGGSGGLKYSKSPF